MGHQDIGTLLLSDISTILFIISNYHKVVYVELQLKGGRRAIIIRRLLYDDPLKFYPYMKRITACTLYRLLAQIKSNQIKYYIIVRPKVDQRAGQLCLPHIEITKTEKNTTKT